jgi:hypothetical protein
MACRRVEAGVAGCRGRAPHSGTSEISFHGRRCRRARSARRVGLRPGPASARRRSRARTAAGRWPTRSQQRSNADRRSSEPIAIPQPMWAPTWTSAALNAHAGKAAAGRDRTLERVQHLGQRGMAHYRVPGAAVLSVSLPQPGGPRRVPRASPDAGRGARASGLPAAQARREAASRFMGPAHPDRNRSRRHDVPKGPREGDRAARWSGSEEGDAKGR